MSRIKHLRITVLIVVALVCCIAFVKPSKPTLFLVGDSTVRNGTGRGDGGLWGWGNFIAELVDTNKITVQNKSLGGTSSLSYWLGGYWNNVQPNIKPRDIVLIQFGHNDGNPTTLKGISDDSMEVFSQRSQKMVMAHTFGWNIRKYIRETKAKGGTPVVVSLVPRSLWKNGKVNRVASEFVIWDKEVATQENVAFIDLNKIVADHYDELGERKVKTEFFNDKDPVHTIEAGARFNAACVIEALKGLAHNPLKKYIL